MRRMKTHANLVYELARADFKLKYYGSFAGLLWSFLKPFLMLLILYGVFVHFLKVSIPLYPWFLLLGLIIWNFFADTTKECMQSAAAKGHIIRNVNVPPQIAVLGTFLHLVWTFLITLGVFGALLAIFRVPFQGGILPVIALLGCLLLFTLGVSLFIVPLFTRFRDFGHLWDIFLQMLFWALPVTYALDMVPSAYRPYYLLNPLAGIIASIRDSVLYGIPPAGSALGYLALSAAAALAVGAFFFMKTAQMIREEL